ncbi:hypothetical protein NYD00_004520 [Salmonella enterica subsp. enterica]|nr:hypothetical protein [Salmonella enterica]EJR2729656.1 hypothetical protein [Salmonella enterica subsp. enterica]ELE3304251.1 hypothetical protein [Salmonella enterica subsp. enterica serovar Newmexico]EGJ1396411.1 hypothetical protein [Salmonella enterica]EGY5172041.1 hypothetical protein [Salmonella enterica]
MLRIIFVLTTKNGANHSKKEADHKQPNQGAMDDTLAVCIAVWALNRGTGLMNEPEFLAVQVMQHRFAVYFILNRGKITPLQHILEQPHIL